MTSSSIKIQEITDTYVPSVDPREWRPDAYKIAFQALNVQGCHRLVAVDALEDVGFAAYRTSTAEGCQLVSIASKYPGRGIGEALVDHIRDQYDVWVYSDRSADKFYEKLGFVQEGVHKRPGWEQKIYRWER